MHTEASDNAQRAPVAIPRTVTTRPNAIGFWYFRLDTVTGMLVRDGSETTASSGDDDVGPDTHVGMDGRCRNPSLSVMRQEFPQVSFVKLETFFGPVQPGVAADDLAIDQVRLNVQYP